CSCNRSILIFVLPVASPLSSSSIIFSFFTNSATILIYTLSLHDALPISLFRTKPPPFPVTLVLRFRKSASCPTLPLAINARVFRSEEHTSELQSRFDLVCRLLLEKKKKHPPHWLINPRTVHQQKKV